MIYNKYSKGDSIMNDPMNETEIVTTDGVKARLHSKVTMLSSKDGMTRQWARLWLVSMGKEAVPLLVESLSDPRPRVRWEAAKALVSIADPGTAPTLVRSLEDPESGVQWLAAEALAALGQAGLEHLLKAMIDRPESVPLLQGAHHICHLLASSDLKAFVEPILDALDHAVPSETVPPAAYNVLSLMKNRA
jgi:hypothetical protein